MKVFFASAKIDAMQELAKKWESQGHAALVISRPPDFWELLAYHGQSLDAVYVDGDWGEDFCTRMKSNPRYSAIPFVLMAEGEIAQKARVSDSYDAILPVRPSFEQVIEVAFSFQSQRALSSMPEVQSPTLIKRVVDLEPNGLERPSPTMVASANAQKSDSFSKVQIREKTETFSSSAIVLEEGLQGSEPGLSPPTLAFESIGNGDESGEVSGGAKPQMPELTVEFGTMTRQEKDAIEKEKSAHVNLAQVNLGGPVFIEPPAGSGDTPEAFEKVTNEPQIEFRVGGSTEDGEAREDMPYLYQEPEFQEHEATRTMGSRAHFVQPEGDAVVPGGAVQSPDAETLKKYLLLREQDVGALSAQLKAAKEQIRGYEDQLRVERGKNVELLHQVEECKKRIDAFEGEKLFVMESAQTEVQELRFEVRSKTDKAKSLESKVKEASEQLDRIKERVRMDIRKIRNREKELENRLEILKKDSEVLLSAREGKIIELKRKLDLAEFNLDLVQEQHQKEKDRNLELKQKLTKVASAMKVAGGFIDEMHGQKDADLEGPDEEKAS